MNRNLIVERPARAAVRVKYVGREAKVFPVFESELCAVSSLSTQGALFSSVGAALLSYAVGIWTNAMFAERLTERANVMIEEVAPVLAILSIGFFGLSAWAFRKRQLLVRNEIRMKSSPG